MVSLTDVKALAKEAEIAFGIGEDELVKFVRDGAVRAYRAGGPGRDGQDVVAEFVGDKKELRVAVRKKVVESVTDDKTQISIESVKAQGLKDGIGSLVPIKITDEASKQNIEAGFLSLRSA